MSVEAMALVLHHAEVAGTDKLVLLGIANHDGDGGAWPTIETLARYAQVSDRSVQRSIRRLAELGLVTVETQAGGTRHSDPRYRPNVYRLTLACPSSCDGSKHHRPRDPGVTPVTPRGDTADAPGVTATSPLTDPGVTLVTPRGDTGVAPGVTLVSPEPSLEPSLEPNKTAPAPAEPVASGDERGLIDRFDRFWKAYPRKAGKPAARRALTAAIKRHGIDPIRSGLDTWRAHWTRQHTPEHLIPHPATWLNQDRFLDAPAATTGQRVPDRTTYL